MSTEPRPLAGSLERLLNHLGAPKARTVVDVFDRWPELVGAEIAKHTKPVSFADNRLVIAASDAAWASQLRWAETELLVRLAQTLGDGEVQSLDIRIE